MPRLVRISLAQSLMILGLAAFLSTLAVDFWNKFGTGVTDNHPVLALSPDGKQLAMNISHRPLFQNRHPVLLKSTSNLAAAASRLDGHTWIVSDVEWSANGSQLYSCSGDRTIRIWDTATGKELSRVSDPALSATCMAISPNETIAALGCGPDVVIVDLLDRRVVTKLTGHPRLAWATAFTPDGKYLLSTGLDRDLVCWDTTNWQKSNATTTSHVRHLEFAPNGELILAGFQAATQTASWVNTVEFRHVPELNITRELPIDSYAAISSLDVSADGSLLVAAHGGLRNAAHNAVTLWNLESMMELSTIEVYAHGDRWINGIELGNNGTTVLCASDDGQVTSLDWSKRKTTKVFSRPGFRWKFAIIGGFVWLCAWWFVSRKPKVKQPSLPVESVAS